MVISRDIVSKYKSNEFNFEADLLLKYWGRFSFFQLFHYLPWLGESQYFFLFLVLFAHIMAVQAAALLAAFSAPAMALAVVFQAMTLHAFATRA